MGYIFPPACSGFVWVLLQIVPTVLVDRTNSVDSLIVDIKIKHSKGKKEYYTLVEQLSYHKMYSGLMVFFVLHYLHLTVDTMLDPRLPLHQNWIWFQYDKHILLFMPCSLTDRQS